jgi:3-hydroxyisobutyrate dehydrogenase
MGGNVAVLGLGTMGAGMAANLLKAGFSLGVYNRTMAKGREVDPCRCAVCFDPGRGGQSSGSEGVRVLTDRLVGVWR